jgi:nucleotide-binding universal stress UspA family protein
MTVSASTSVPAEARFCLVVGLKLDDGGAFAVEEAVRVAQRIPQCAFHLVHVVAKDPGVDERRELIGHLRLYANEKVQSLGGAHGMTIGIHVRTGDVSRSLASFARDVSADLLIVGSENHHRLSWYRTPKVEELLEATTCPVVVAGPKPRPHTDASASPPVIEPPCPACIQTRAATSGATWWCPQHAGHVERPHTFSYQRELPLRTPDTLVFPTGMGG